MDVNHSWIGKIVGGCRLEKWIGQGGMGVVYRARQLSLERTVAVKILLEQCFSGAEREQKIQRFYREARLAGQLQHPNAVQIYDVGEENGTYYILMQFIEGVSLAQLLDQKGRFELAEALPVFRGVAEVLAAAHEKGIIHRDIKPGNILQRRDRGIVVADFGLARSTGGNSGFVSAPGIVIGSLGFMSPEQAQGLENIDARTDIYSLGATMFALLTGKPAFHGSSPVQTLYLHVNQEPPRMSETRPEMPGAIDDLVHAMMQRDPAKRPASARRLLDEIRKIEPGLRPSRPNIPRRPSSGKASTQLISMSLLTGEHQLACRVQRILGVSDIVPCQSCGREWDLDEVAEKHGVLYQREVWCPRCLWERLPNKFSGCRVGEVEKGSFGTYWMAIRGVEEYLPGRPPRILYCFPLNSPKKGWEKMLQRIERGFNLASEIRSNLLVRNGKYTRAPEHEIAYVAMDYEPCVRLGEFLKSLRKTQKYLPVSEALPILRKLANAIQVLHSHSLVHRNVTPNAVYLGINGGVRLGNYNMAKRSDMQDSLPNTLALSDYCPEDSQEEAAETGAITTDLRTVLGTLAYMAPEQTEGARDVDQRADIWAWGAISFEVLEGKPLFPEKSPLAMVQEIRTRTIPEFSGDIPAELRRIVARSLEKDPAKRYQSANEIKSALDTIHLDRK